MLNGNAFYLSFIIERLSFQLASSIRQHRRDTSHVGFGNERVNIQIAFALARFLRQNVARVAVPALGFAVRRQAHALRRAFVRFKFWHDYSSLRDSNSL